jgi:adenosylcobinamide-phosphate synthase
MVFFCLAGKTLRQEVQMTFEAADRSVEEGRRQVARIVGRDTSNLSAQEVRTAALETLAENLSDGVVAPLFWMLLLGVPGMMTYKMVNTLDSMIGYRTERYEKFGCWAAKIDDYANYIPARLTAVLIVFAEKLMRWKQTSVKWLMEFVARYGSQHASPNSGWPEAALAGVLDCQFGGGHNYFGVYFHKPFIGDYPRPLTTADMWRSLQIAMVVETMMVGLMLLVSLIPSP